MAELYSSNNIPPTSGGGVGGRGGETTDDNEPRIDGDGQEVNSLRFLGAGAPAPQILGTGPGTAPQNPPPSSITPSAAVGVGGGGGGVGGVSQPLQNQQQPHPPPPSQTPHQQVVTHNLNQSVVSSQGVPNTPLGVGVGGTSSYDPYDPSRGQPTSYGGAPAMQMPSGPYAAAMAGQMAMMMAPGGYPGGYGPMGMAPMYASPFNPYGAFPGMMAPQPQPQPQQPSFSPAELSARLQVLRVQNPTYYREWYKKYEAHRSNPRRYPFPLIEVPIPGFPSMGGPGSSQTLPARYGRSRKESTRSSVNGDPYRERHHHHPNDSLLEYTSLPHNNSSISRGHPHHHPRPHSSGRASVNGTLPPPEDDFDGDGAPGGGGGVNSLTADMSNLNLLGQISNSSFHHPLNSTLNSQYQQHPPGGDGSGGSGRGETQSGRSSTIGEPYPAMVQRDIYGGYPQDMQGGYDRYPPGGGGGVDSRFGFQPISREPTPPPRGRTTPMKFSTFHCIATMTPLGHMIRIRNGGGQQQVLEFVKMRQLVGHLPEFREMEGFPGPLTQQLTHKSTVIQFCKRKIKEARSNPAQVDRNNYVLLWEFLMLMLRQNGMVVGSDIAELLLTTVQQQKQEEQERRAAALQILEEQQQQVVNNRDSIVEGSDGTSMDGGEDGNSGVEKEEGEGESSGGEEDSTSQKLPPPPPTAPPRDENKLVEEFCSHLLEGHKKDALEFAMDNGLWGHALFFASKMDERSYGHVLARFANGIPLHSPLQTLYHIMCGKQPASVTNCGDVMEADESSSSSSMTFGDWKPHLAMLLSNSGYKPDVERRAILTLGDTLHSRNHVFAAQFCYLMGLEEFNKQSRLGTLLGYSKENKNVLEATQMTEVYEFARKLADPGFSLGVSFLQSKLEYGMRLVSYGFVEEALAYCEEITKVLKQSKLGGGGNFGVGEDSDQELISLCVKTLNIAERIAAADENGTAAQTWVDELRRMAMGEGGEDVVRRVSMLGENDSSSGGSVSNQEYAPSYATSQQSQQALYSSSVPAIGGGGELPQTSAPTFYDPNSGQQLATGQGQEQGQSAITQQQQQQQQQVDGALNEMGGYGGGQQEVQQDSNSWGGGMGGVSQQQQQQQPMMNGGLHLSQPQQNPPQQQQQPMYDPSQMYGGGEQTVGGGYQQQQQQPMMDGGNSVGMSGYGGDKFTNAGGNTGNTTTINNNSWYSPYDQPSTGGGPNAGHDYSKEHQYQQQQQQPPLHNSSPVKLTSAQKKSVRFVEDASKQTPPPPQTTTAAQVVEGDNHNSSKSVKENGNSASGGDVGGGGLRARNVGGSRVDPIDLKSALKNRQRERQQVAGLGVSVVNGGGGGSSNGGGGGGGDSFDNLEDDLEGQGRICGGIGGFEVEFKSTYPIDEPISHHQMSNRLPSPNVQTIAQQQQQQMRLVNRKAQIRNSHSTATAQQTQQKPPPLPQHNQQISGNHLPESRTVQSPQVGGGFGRRKTYPVDKECCTANQPCEDHEDFLEDEEDEDEDLDVDDEDEEGGIGGDIGNGVENGGSNDGGEDGGRYPNHLQHYTRCENKTENNQQPLSTSPSSPSAAKKDDKKKGKEGGGGQQQEKGWFSGLFKVLKPKNQMILPDDKNPTIVWDDKQKRWVNTVGDGEDDTAPAGPPPKDSDLMRPPPQMPMSNGPQNPPPGGMGGAYQQQQQQPPPQQQQQPAYNNLQQNSLPNPSQLQSQGGMGNMMGVPSNTTLNNNNSSNKYKLQKGRALKGYVDVFNPNGPTPATSPSSNSIPPLGGIPGANPSAAPPNMFIPPPMPSSGGGAGGQGGGEMDGGNVSFLTPAPVTQLAEDPNSQQDISQQPPPMFNPAQFHQGYPQQGQ